MSACDYSSARPGGAALQAAGITAVGRYLAGDPNYAGALGPAELADLTAHKIAVWVNYEGSSTGMLGGYAAGVAHGQKAAANLVRLGLTVGDVVVFASADFDVQVSDFPACDAYMDGFQSVLGTGGEAIYGGMRIINHFRANGKAKWFWKSAASSWDHGETGFVHIEQTTNPSLPGTDNDIIHAAVYGQIGASLADLGSNPFQEDDMTPDQDSKLTACFEALFGPANAGATTPLTWKNLDGSTGTASYGLLPILIYTQQLVAQQAGQIAGVMTAVQAVQAGQPIDMTAVTKAAEDGAAAALQNLVLKPVPPTA